MVWSGIVVSHEVDSGRAGECKSETLRAWRVNLSLAATKFHTALQPTRWRVPMCHLTLATTFALPPKSVGQNILVAGRISSRTPAKVARVLHGNDTLRPQASEI